MGYRPLPRHTSFYRNSRRARLKQHHRGLLLLGLLLGIICILPLSRIHAEIATTTIRSVADGNCLDDYRGVTAANARVDISTCGSPTQEWTASYERIMHGITYCLGVQGDSPVAGSRVVMNPCSQTPGQVWLSDQGGFINPNSGLCLTAPTQLAQSLTVEPCHLHSMKREQWSLLTARGTPYNLSCSNLTKGQLVACLAVAQWATWQSTSANHNNSLNLYTDGNNYEEWCADFVSYIYKMAKQPFTQGERDNWDEYDANNIRNMGFTMHDPASYIPQPGDIAYFNYAGGHVEIVASGGPTPTFVYGDSGTIDPATGNGDMEANTITSDGSLGQLVYYLSPK